MPAAYQVKDGLKLGSGHKIKSQSNQNKAWRFDSYIFEIVVWVGHHSVGCLCSSTLTKVSAAYWLMDSGKRYKTKRRHFSRGNHFYCQCFKSGFLVVVLISTVVVTLSLYLSQLQRTLHFRTLVDLGTFLAHFLVLTLSPLHPLSTIKRRVTQWEGHWWSMYHPKWCVKNVVLTMSFKGFSHFSLLRIRDSLPELAQHLRKLEVAE